MRPLSYTQINTYKSCPLSYKLQYIDRLKPKDKWYFSFGSTLHKCAESFFRVRVPPPPSREELLCFYEDNWLSQGYESAEEEANYKQYGREILTQFWEIHSDEFRMPLAVEKMFYIDVEGIKLRGFIDRVDKLESGGLAITDYKSSRELFTNQYVENDLQLTLYQMAAEQTWQLPVERLTLYHLRSNTAVSCEARDNARLNQARQLVLDVAEGITREMFPPTENQNCPCDFPEHCPYYRHQYLDIAIPPEVEETPELTTDEMVAQYTSLQAQVKALQYQLDELRLQIIDYCDKHELSRIYGREHAITRRLVEKTGFDEDEVRQLLEPEGLWPQVLSLDLTKLKQFLAHEETAREIRKELASMKRIISRYSQLLVKKLEEEK